MPPLTLLVTASGAPGARALLRALKQNGEREVRVVGCDMNPRSIGRFVADAFHVVPAGHTPEFAPAVLDICKREDVDVLLPESSNDILELARNKASFEAEGIRVMVSRANACKAGFGVSATALGGLTCSSPTRNTKPFGPTRYLAQYTSFIRASIHTRISLPGSAA